MGHANLVSVKEMRTKLNITHCIVWGSD